MSTLEAQHELEACVAAYWHWLATQPAWRGVSLPELKAQYIDVGQDGPAYERILRELEQRVRAAIDVANAATAADPDPALLTLLLEAVLLDYLWEDILDLCVTELHPTTRSALLRAGTQHWSYHVRLLCVARLPQDPFPDAEAWLVDLLHADSNVHVQRYALLSLAQLHPARAVVFAQGFLHAHHPDTYMILASIDVVAAYDPALLRPHQAWLQQHPSPYVRQRVPTFSSK